MAGPNPSHLETEYPALPQTLLTLKKIAAFDLNDAKHRPLVFEAE